MAIKQAPYITFNGQAEEALEFYREVFGGALEITRFSEVPMEGMPDDPNGVMHGQLELEGGITIMASDGGEGPGGESNVVICIYGDDKAELEGLFTALENGGSASIPFSEAPWGSWFGQVSDRFGVAWMLEGGGEQDG